jgi:hypothetical protein
MKMSNKKGQINKTLTIHGIWMERIVTIVKMVMFGKKNPTDQLEMVKNKIRT